MTLEEFYTARQLDRADFMRKLETNPEFEKEYYDWVDYLTVASLQDKSQLQPGTKLAYSYRRSYE